jgi:hypothetical protein
VVDTYYSGSPAFGGSALLINGGSVTDSSSPGVRRTLDLEVAPKPGQSRDALFDVLSPRGTQLKVRSVLRYPSGSTESVPLGVFDITNAKVDYGPNGTLTVQADDKWAGLQRACFLRPKQSWAGLTIVEQIKTLIREVYGPAEQVTVLTSNTDTVGTLVWEKDRDKAIIELADSIGCWVYADRNGVFTIADLPTGDPGASVWSVDAGASGVLLTASRSRDRSGSFNVVVVTPEQADGTPPVEPQIVWDNDPSSPTYAGADPVAGSPPGPFGIAVDFFSSPVTSNPSQAQIAGLARLARVKGLHAQLSLTASRNHALDALDSIAVTLPSDSYGAPTITEKHFIDKVVHGLMPSDAQTIETRSTNVDA